ncbi:MAG: SMP-30/gluconolactonase/LRE family protein [Chloroflexi bacterium]|nr:SMP-30/gluconolactonase/LRE family protein [Chloroflexota bacterium]
MRSSAFEGLILPDERLRKLGDGYQWAEGTTWVPDDSESGGGYLLWSDIPNDRMLRWSESDGTTVFRQPCGYTNGHTLDREGRLVSCEHGGRRVSRTEPDGTVVSLVDSYEGKRLNSPNDLVVKSDGTIWFTDPPYGILSDREGHKAESELGANYVFRLWPDTGKIEIVSDRFDRPNGIAFSPDESVLYVSDTGHEPDSPEASIHAFDAAPDGALSNHRIYARPDSGKSDGFRVDSDGNVWSSAGDGVHVFSPAGELLGVVLTPDRNANLDFGGPDGTTLFIAVNQEAYSIKVNARRAARP